MADGSRRAAVGSGRVRRADRNPHTGVGVAVGWPRARRRHGGQRVRLAERRLDPPPPRLLADRVDSTGRARRCVATRGRAPAPRTGVRAPSPTHPAPRRRRCPGHRRAAPRAAAGRVPVARVLREELTDGGRSAEPIELEEFVPVSPGAPPRPGPGRASGFDAKSSRPGSADRIACRCSRNGRNVPRHRADSCPIASRRQAQVPRRPQFVPPIHCPFPRSGRRRRRS